MKKWPWYSFRDKRREDYKGNTVCVYIQGKLQQLQTTRSDKRNGDDDEREVVRSFIKAGDAGQQGSRGEDKPQNKTFRRAQHCSTTTRRHVTKPYCKTCRTELCSIDVVYGAAHTTYSSDTTATGASVH